MKTHAGSDFTYDKAGLKWSCFRTGQVEHNGFFLHADPTPRYIITAIDCMAPRGYGNGDDSAWLENARRLDAALMSTAPDIKLIVDDLFESILAEIEKSGTVKKPKAKKTLQRVKQTTKVIILNLYLAYLLGVPVRYSRNRNRYGIHKRYGMVFFKYSRVIACIDALQVLGLIKKKKGFYDRRKNIGRESRIWATPELISFFHQVNLHRQEQVIPEPRQEIIELRNEAKKPIGYADTKKNRRMRDNLESYNNFIEQQEIILQLDASHRVSLNTLDREIWLFVIVAENKEGLTD